MSKNVLVKEVAQIKAHIHSFVYRATFFCLKTQSFWFILKLVWIFLVPTLGT